MSICFLSFFRKKPVGGGVVLDIGVYVLQLAQFIFKDEPKKVTVNGEINDEGIDIVNTVILEYDNDRRAVLNATGKLKLWNQATIYGTKGRITVRLKSKNLIVTIFWNN